VRDWLERAVVDGRPWPKRAPAPALPADVIAKNGREVSRRAAAPDGLTSYGLATPATTQHRHRQREKRARRRLPARPTCRDTEPGSARFAQADADMATLRGRYEGKPRAAISAWLHLAEGLRSHYTDLGHAARDKIQRAHALSAAAGLDVDSVPLRGMARASGLSAHGQPRRLHGTQARRLQLAAPEDHAAQSRANLVVAQALDEAGRFDLARPWYDQAHHHATTEGDDATLSAMM